MARIDPETIESKSSWIAVVLGKLGMVQGRINAATAPFRYTETDQKSEQVDG